jgi:chloramphenicol O-acetyltransferase type A
MAQTLPGYQLIDLDRWPRREHFQYYRDTIKCSYSLTARLDVTELVQYAKERGLRFYGCFLYAVSRAVNEQEEMRMMLDQTGAPGLWDEVHPNFTVFHPDDHTFSDLWTEYHRDFGAFYQDFVQTVERYGASHGVKGRPGQPANFFCISCVPWMDYTGFSSQSVGEPALFPILTFGRYTRTEGRDTLPLTLTISHASADGYHAAQFFQSLQALLTAFPRLAEQNK